MEVIDNFNVLLSAYRDVRVQNFIECRDTMYRFNGARVSSLPKLPGGGRPPGTIHNLCPNGVPVVSVRLEVGGGRECESLS